ncbi:hypothetical protein BDZ94DRAFT_946888 [Collybia nuda]|uniref:Uncharacterized protein n=1 Tax=Collybia nuda TaxID=64659 RepID=A0A9P6CGL9_9AGAR|nr:hypothetical protein BDZ94DRAFT_946888 [Collybia nuda]
MDDVPYTTPDEDPFNIQPLQPRRRRSSLLNKWIQEQQNQISEPDAPLPPQDPHVTYITPYLAYPDLTLERTTVRDDVLTTDGYDLVEDDDIPQDLAYPLDLPSTPTTTRSRRTSRLIQTPSSFRSFNISFKSTSPLRPRPSDSSSPRPSSRLSLFPRSPRHSTDAVAGRCVPHQHNRSSSLSTLNLTSKNDVSGGGLGPGFPTKWRPSVLGHFSSSGTSQSSVAPSEMAYTPSRPSISSGDTYPSTATDYDFPGTPLTMNFMDSLRSRSRSQRSVFKTGIGISSSSSVWSQNGDIPYSGTHERSMSASQIASSSASTLAYRVNPKRIPLGQKPGSKLAGSNIDYDGEHDNGNGIAKPLKYDPTRPHIAYSSGGTHPRVNFTTLTSRQKKKKKLVVMGVAHEDERKFAGVKRWCESFGEISQITRMPNGDLHVHFRLAEVADTVCRLRAKVFIAGVGSVQLSWFTGDKR